MKKLTTLILAVTVFSAAAQLTVTNNQTVIGKMASVSGFNPSSELSSTTSPITVPSISIDTTANLCILGKYTSYAGGKISFGNSNKVTIGEYGTYDSNRLLIDAWGGLQYHGISNTIFSHNGYSSGKFIFNTPVEALSFNTTSDARLKKDVTDLGDVSTGLALLNPVSFRMAGLPIPSDSIDQNGQETDQAEIDNRLRYGFIAQEVKEVFPELVSENPYGYLSIDYIGFIPMLVAEVQKLQAKVEEQEEIIGAISAQNAPRRNASAGTDDIETITASLSQNRPNPFTSTTTIECTLPETISDAALRVYDLQGKQIMKLRVDGRGKTSVTIDGSTLSAGIYIYSLIADGQEIDSKRMILTD